MLEQSPTKVKRKIKSLADRVSCELSFPQHKFLLEMLGSTLSSGSLNLMELARNLKEDIVTKHVHKRIQRNLSNCGVFLNLSNDYILRHPAETIRKDSFICLDGGDLTYSQASNYEQMTRVYDGSSGKLKPGYLYKYDILPQWRWQSISCLSGYISPIDSSAVCKGY